MRATGQPHGHADTHTSTCTQVKQSPVVCYGLSVSGLQNNPKLLLLHKNDSELLRGAARRGAAPAALLSL